MPPRHRQPTPQAPNTSPGHNRRSGFSRLAVIALVPLIGLAIGSGLLWLEYKTLFAARHIGEYLMRQNHERQPRGALWQGLIASRQTRLALADSLAGLTIKPHSTPFPVLQNHYRLQHHGPNAVFLRVTKRTTHLKPELLAPGTLRELSRSLQIYQDGLHLLTNAAIPTEPLRIHALIATQIALEDNTLFSTLHRHLIALNSTEAWTFLRMEPEEMEFWRSHLGPLLEIDQDATDHEVSPFIQRALDEIVEARQDSLRQVEITRLLKGWDQVDGFELRLSRAGDHFAAYALYPGEVPPSFSLPVHALTEWLGLSLEEPAQ